MLPSASAVGEGGEISDRELDAVPGGGTWGGDTGVPPPAIAAKGPAGAKYIHVISAGSEPMIESTSRGRRL